MEPDDDAVDGSSGRAAAVNMLSEEGARSEVSAGRPCDGRPMTIGGSVSATLGEVRRGSGSGRCVGATMEPPRHSAARVGRGLTPSSTVAVRRGHLPFDPSSPVGGAAAAATGRHIVRRHRWRCCHGGSGGRGAADRGDRRAADLELSRAAARARSAAAATAAGCCASGGQWGRERRQCLCAHRCGRLCVPPMRPPVPSTSYCPPAPPATAVGVASLTCFASGPPLRVARRGGRRRHLPDSARCRFCGPVPRRARGRSYNRDGGSCGGRGECNATRRGRGVGVGGRRGGIGGPRARRGRHGRSHCVRRGGAPVVVEAARRVCGLNRSGAGSGDSGGRGGALTQPTHHAGARRVGGRCRRDRCSRVRVDIVVGGGRGRAPVGGGVARPGAPGGLVIVAPAAATAADPPSRPT